jgi:dedicator of cytokinesis protein 3
LFFFFRGLLSSVQHCADWATSTDRQEPIQKTFRSLEYIFKFIIQSRILFSRATGGQYEDSFKRDLLCVFASINKMLGQTGDVILPTQVHTKHSNLHLNLHKVKMIWVVMVALRYFMCDISFLGIIAGKVLYMKKV